MMRTLNLTIPKANTIVIDIERKTSSGAVVDITNYKYFFTAKNNYTDADASAVISTSVSTHSDPTNGVTAITLTAAMTNITEGSYYYDIKEVTATSSVNTMVKGVLTVDWIASIRTS
jgi:hypothetical protein